MYHMFSKGLHQRLQEGGLRAHRQVHIGAMGRNAKEPSFKNWTIPENIDMICAFMANMSRAERKHLSKLGAVRLSRRDALKFMHSHASTQHFYT
eukprot:11888056-Heterocapsa_arctica.AAC.1